MNEGLGERKNSLQPGSYTPNSAVNNGTKRPKGMLCGLSLKPDTKPNTPRVEARPFDNYTASVDQSASSPNPPITSTDAAAGGLAISDTHELPLDDLINTSSETTLAGSPIPPTGHADAQKISDGSALLHMQ